MNEAEIDLLVLPACMGGWCQYRNRCMQHLTPHRADVVERLCEKGAETPVPVLTRPETVQ